MSNRENPRGDHRRRVTDARVQSGAQHIRAQVQDAKAARSTTRQRLYVTFRILPHAYLTTASDGRSGRPLRAGSVLLLYVTVH